MDPTLTLSCPADVSAHVGLDTLCQVRVCMYIYSTIALTLLAAMYVCMYVCMVKNIEPYVSNLPNPFVDALSREG